MNLSAIFHRSTGSCCYALDNDTVVVSLRTGYDVEKAWIFSEDPFIHELRREREWTGVKQEMRRDMELENHVVWTIEIKPEYKRLRYYFVVEAEGEQYCVFENKICPIAERDRISTGFFKFPWINPVDVITPPSWVRRTIWYQIMPDRFRRNADAKPDSKFRNWGDMSSPGFNDLYGGTIKGITEKLPYLKELGISGIYLTPIFLSNSNHKYNTFDYKTIDPDFGTDADMRELADKAHEMGIHLMLDAVFNHCGTEFFAWKDVCEKGRASTYFDWFFINSDDFVKNDFTTADKRYYTFSFWSPMPKLNTNNPDVQAYFGGVCEHWIKEWDIDGIRFDVGDEISHAFIRSLNRRLKALKPDIFLLGEIWMDSIGWLNGYEYDSVMNYPFTDSVGDFWRDKSMTSTAFMHRINFCLSLYPKQINETLFTFLDTHDTSRAVESCENTDVLLQKLAVLLTMPGSPCLYYGTEIAMRGLHTPYTRSCMPWEEIDEGVHDAFREKTAKLLQVRQELPDTEISTLRFFTDSKYPRLVSYQRDNLSVYINAGDTPCEIFVNGSPIFTNKFENGALQKDGVLIVLK